MLTANPQLEDLLQRIGYKLDLTKTQHESAEEKYRAVNKWLKADLGIIGQNGSDIYPQGSMRLGTTVKPTSRQELEGKVIFQELLEFDLDFVYLLLLDFSRFTPIQILNALEKRFREHEVYGKMVERKNRCIRLNYSNEFHMDILPACSINPDSTIIAIPDREKRSWLSSNPKGYAGWFEERAGQGRKAFCAAIEPLPDHTHFKPPLVRVVQLLKRWRDRSFTKEMAPCSILLTTLAGYLFEGQITTLEAFHALVDKLEKAVRGGKVIEVINPVNYDELFSEGWIKNPTSYHEFCRQIENLVERIKKLQESTSLEAAHKILKDLFGEEVVSSAFRDSAKATQKLREQNKLKMNTATGALGVTAVHSVAVKPTTFYGA